MKTRLIAGACLALLMGVSVAMAQPPGKGRQFRTHKSLRTVEDFESVKTGDKLVFVCQQCKSVAEADVMADGDAMAYCKEDGVVTCPLCTKTYKTVLHGPPGKGQKQRRVTYVNDAGEECAFVAIVKSEAKSGD
jgi:hypothetical protein